MRGAFNIGQGFFNTEIVTITRTKNKAGGFDTKEETREEKSFSRPLGSTDRVLLETGDFTINDRKFYFSGRFGIELNDLIEYEGKRYEARNINYRRHGNFTDVVGKEAIR